MEIVKRETQVLFARGVIAPTLKEAQEELMKKARAQGLEGKRFSSQFMKENKQLIDHILALHREYRRNGGQNEGNIQSDQTPLEMEVIHIHDAGQKRADVGRQRWDQTTLDLKLRRISTFIEHADEDDLEEFRDRTITPALKSTLKELKSRAHAQGKEGERYNAAFMKDQKPLIDHALALHSQYKEANKKINAWKEEYDLLEGELPDLSKFGTPPWEARRNQETVAPKKTLSGLFRGAMAKAEGVAAIALTAAFGLNSMNGNDAKGVETTASTTHSQSLLHRIGMFTGIFNAKAKDSASALPMKVDVQASYTSVLQPK